MCCYSILERAKRPYVNLEICISTFVLMCVSVCVFVSVHGCVCVCLNLDSLRDPSEGSRGGTLGKTREGTTDYVFSHPVGSHFDSPTASNYANALKVMQGSTLTF